MSGRHGDGGVGEVASLKIRVVTRAARRGIECGPQGTLKAHLHSAPVGGRANRELVELVADLLAVRRACVELVRGEKSRHKVIRVVGVGSAAAVRMLREATERRANRK